MRKKEVENASNMVTGNFSIRTHAVEVLLDSGAMYSFIFANLVSIIQGTLTSRYSLLNIALPNGKVVDRQELFIDYRILIQ